MGSEPHHRERGGLPSKVVALLGSSRLAGNATSLYAAHLLGLLVPLITVPYLARVLRPEGWGLVLFAQSFAAWLYLVMEFGFELSGTRAVARVRGKKAAFSVVAARIQGAKILLFLGLSPLVLTLLLLVPLFRDHPAYLLWAWLFAGGRALFPNWYFFGQERMPGPAFAEAVARAAAALGVFLLVHNPDDGWRVLALQAVAMGIAMVWMTERMRRETMLRWPGIGPVLETLRESVGVFIFRSSTGLYVQGSAFILGLLATPLAVGFFGGADRIIRAVVGLLQPLSQAFFPRISRLMVKDREEAGRILRMSLVAIGGLGVLMGCATYWASPLLVALLLGPGYESSVPILRVMASLPPIIGLGTVFGIQWALPAGLERPFYLLVLLAGAANLVAALALVPLLDALGMAISVVLAELLVAMGLVFVFRWKGGTFWPLLLGPQGNTPVRP